MPVSLRRLRQFVRRGSWFIGAWFLCSTVAHALPGGTLLDGRYTGWIKLDAAQERIALVVDIFQESPENFTIAPSRNAIFKLSLGGYNTHEYFTETFKDIHSDFDNGTLTLDEPNNDLLITAEVQALGSAPLLVGKVFIRSSAVWGTVYLKYETDEPEERSSSGAIPRDEEPGSGGGGAPGEPDAGQGVTPETAPFIPLLEGQYVGLCNGGTAALQIQTVRGLNTKSRTGKDRFGLGPHYGIVGRLSGISPDVCGTIPKGLWCNHFNYDEGSYNLYQGKLVLKGRRSTDACDIHQGEIKCRIQLQGGVGICTLKKTTLAVQAPRFFARAYHLSVTADQEAVLPEAAPPANADLTAALRGTFSGYLHNETNDTYQVFQLNVFPYSTTNNPHNLNQMTISTTSSAYFGGDVKGSYSTQRFEPRSFYLRPGFTLSGPSSDAFIAIQQWQTGLIRGIWYSHNFGRVGTVELVKSALPAANSSMVMIKNFAGQFKGTAVVGSSVKRWIELLFPVQPNLADENVIEFEGSQQSLTGISAIQIIEKGSFDPYTGRMGWIYARGGAETFISAYLDPSDQLKIYWPPAPDVFGALMADFEFDTYKRIKLP